ncbi:MAG: MBL fold metallo-hydrolase [Methanobacterium sp.]|uniref:MBL fold metallo-hydrolase n=1 Tax=Methanobacterium sp. TaxID=2164 RepID=UPI003D6534EE|nr:MBL fold metallo-hydrolase [Methanobacterium sp.]
MILEIIKSEGLAHNSYFIGSKGDAAVIDPRRDCDSYVNYSKKHDMKIKHIFETHRNEDYVIGSCELSKRVDASIYHGSCLDFSYGNYVKEGNTFHIGSVELGILETPGHTDESISLTLKDKDVSDDIYMVFTGDTLFAGEVGRTDIYGDAKIEGCAERLYDSLHQKILPLGDHVLVFPSHGSGSVCGKNIRESEFTTIGYEKKTNKMLLKTKKEFIKFKLNEKMVKPPYFKRMEEYNQKGAPILCRLPYLQPLNVAELKKNISDFQVVDVRMAASYAGGHIPQTLNIWKLGLTYFAGWMLDYEHPIVIIDEGNENINQIIRYLIRIGYNNIFGYLAGGFASWATNGEELETIDTWSVHKLNEAQNDESIFILDVREIGEWDNGHIEGAHHIYVGYLKNHLNKIPKDKNIIIYCDTGNRASIAASILKNNGYNKVTNVLGSIRAWKAAGYPLIK